MKKILSAMAASLLFVLAFAGTAGAQDETTVGTVTSDPATVAEAGEATVTATGSGFLPETTLLLGSCTSPADELVPGVSTPEEIGAAAGEIDPLANCDIANALQVTTDADGGFTQEVTADIQANFFLTAGTLPGQGDPQAGAVWIPIVDAAAAGQLAVTGVDSGVLAGAGAALVLMGAVAVRASRKED